MIVCICNNVSDRKIEQAVSNGTTSMAQLRECLAVGTCCGKCHSHAKQVLRECLSLQRSAAVGVREQFQPMIFQAIAA
ncbi:bacterioferritin-associated ferredoxin [Noviherbaspirillum humi]|uniref:Bacterioferritin-associated ferredoxin n=1 Tax=Noviherbaspirillum humi TaxID=1688639 RepID=A0A239KA91_9BURK|nr:(2Fe-2S)-binding protein [Noviherbaspirillum humi]SNT14549.1 bacterioferritin-associated ferredoxin [Noviherbaspirillum humi]